MEIPMPARFALSTVTAAILCSSLPARAEPAQQDFPDGPGKATFVAHCGGCHDINRARAGYTPEGWRTVVRMMQNADVPVPKDQWETLTQYLITSFPEKPRPIAVVIDGPQQVRLRVWQVPTPGSRPHDPMAGKDGSIWYTGQHRTIVQQARTARSEKCAVQGI
jgi:virginiamycin B lyase